MRGSCDEHPHLGTQLHAGRTQDAEWDEQVSEGKALSGCEEAVLQALEIMTRGRSETVWLKVGGVREEVARLLG